MRAPTTPRLRSTLAIGAITLVLAIVATACANNGEGSSANRGASGASATAANSCGTTTGPTVPAPSTTTTVVDPSGSPCDQVNVGEFCKGPSDFTWVRNIVTCFRLSNQTRRFSAPDQLGARFELTVPYADCGPSGPPTPCRERATYRGFPRWQGTGSVYGRRTLTPNPFADNGYIQFQPDSIWQGTHARLYVGSQQSPMTLSQGLAQPDFENPSSVDNTGNCDTQGEFFTCSLDPGSWSTSGTDMKPVFTFNTKPMRIRVIDSIANANVTLKRQSSSAGSGFLLDPVAESNMDVVTKSSPGLLGGYRQVSGTGAKTWSATYCIDNPSATATGCVPVDVLIAYSFKDGQFVNDSTCNVTNRSASVTYICDKPSLTPNDEDIIATINVRDF